MQENNFNKLLEVLEEIKKEVQEIKRITDSERDRNSLKPNAVTIISLSLTAISLIIMLLDYLLK